MAQMITLTDLPNNKSACYLPYIPSLRQKQRATAFVEGCYGKSASLSTADEGKSIQVLARVYRSQRKSEDLHTTTLEVDRDSRTITEAYCSCKAGNIQVLDEDIGHLRNQKSSPISYLVESTGAMVDTPLGQQLIGSALAYHAPLMQPLKLPRGESANNCGDIVFPKTPSMNFDAVKDIGGEWSHLDVTLEEAIQIEQDTRRQSGSAKWMEERKRRITASNFGAVMNRKKAVNDKFIKNTFDKGFFTSEPTSYGKANEIIAKQMYINQTGYHIHDIGFVINPAFSFLGATPDAMVCEKQLTGRVEIKCPYSVRDLTLIEACDMHGRDFFLEKHGDQIKLSKCYMHWYQDQGQLLVIGAPFCDFVTFTKQDFLVERIYPDFHTMNTLLVKLSDMYIRYFKPYFANKCM